MTVVIYFEITTNCKFQYLYSQVDISGNRKAIVIHVPYRLRKGFKKIHVRLVRELEKKFSGKVSLSFTEKEKKVILFSL
jgi:Ribosomal protein S7e